MATDNITIRALSTIAEFEELSRFERQVRGYSDLDAMPVRIYSATTVVLGGQLIAAFDGERMAGYCLSLPGFGPGEEQFLYGFGIAVLPEYRNMGIGRGLKFAQREDALRRGIRRMRWVIDPLQLKNGHFNMEVLGATARRFLVNYQGVNSLPDGGGLPTDLCMIEWDLDGERARAAARGERIPRPRIEETIEVPASISEVIRRDRAEARAIQRRVAAQFLGHFAAGLRVTGFERTANGGVYLLASAASHAAFRA